MVASCIESGFLNQNPGSGPVEPFTKSLYSTATQNTWRQELALGSAHDVRILCWGYQHVGILELTQADAKPKICVLPDRKPKRKPVEYLLHWVPTQNSGVGHVHFMFFVLISFALGSQREHSFQWNIGLNVNIKYICITLDVIRKSLLFKVTMRSIVVTWIKKNYN